MRSMTPTRSLGRTSIRETAMIWEIVKVVGIVVLTALVIYWIAGCYEVYTKEDP